MAGASAAGTSKGSVDSSASGTLDPATFGSALSSGIPRERPTTSGTTASFSPMVTDSTPSSPLASPSIRITRSTRRIRITPIRTAIPFIRPPGPQQLLLLHELPAVLDQAPRISDRGIAGAASIPPRSV